MRQTAPSHVDARTFIKSVHGLRYQVLDVARSVAFYTKHLGFTLEHQQLPAFASVSLGDSQILLSGPGASGSRPMPDGELQEPGGWNRIVLKVSDLPGCIAALKRDGLRFRNEMETGPGGRQIQIENPDGNPKQCGRKDRMRTGQSGRKVMLLMNLTRASERRSSTNGPRDLTCGG
jgi:glyoxylase I family protein